MDCTRAMIRAIKQRSLHDFPSGSAMLTSRISQRQNSPGSAFKGSIRLEIASHRNKIAIKPTVSNAQAMNQAFKFPIALNNSSISHNFFVRTVVIILIQDPAHKINYLHFAMASCRVLMVLVRIYLYEREHAHVFFLHGGSRNSDSGSWPIGL